MRSPAGGRPHSSLTYVTRQVKLAAPCAPVVSVAVTVTLNVPVRREVVPLIRPVEALMDRPVGRPLADQVNVWPDWLSDAVICRLT